MEYIDYKDFFDHAGEHYVHPKTYGESLYPVTVEELYQHFKTRLINEISVRSDELLNDAEIIDTSE